MGIPTIVKLEENPKVESLLPLGPGFISGRCTPITKTGISNFTISVKVILTSFGTLCLTGAAYAKNYNMILLLKFPGTYKQNFVYH